MSTLCLFVCVYFALWVVLLERAQLLGSVCSLESAKALLHICWELCSRSVWTLFHLLCWGLCPYPFWVLRSEFVCAFARCFFAIPFGVWAFAPYSEHIKVRIVIVKHPLCGAKQNYSLWGRHRNEWLWASGPADTQTWANEYETLDNNSLLTIRFRS